MASLAGSSPPVVPPPAAVSFLQSCRQKYDVPHASLVPLCTMALGSSCGPGARSPPELLVLCRWTVLVVEVGVDVVNV